MNKLNLNLSINFIQKMSQEEIDDLIEDITSYVLNQYSVTGVGYDSETIEV